MWSSSDWKDKSMLDLRQGELTVTIAGRARCCVGLAWLDDSSPLPAGALPETIYRRQI